MMQMVIDIPTKDYNRIVHGDDIEGLRKCVASGRIIPEGEQPNRQVIEDIIAEIRHNADRDIGGNSYDFVSGYRCSLGEALEIIDKHTSGKEKE